MNIHMNLNLNSGFCRPIPRRIHPLFFASLVSTCRVSGRAVSEFISSGLLRYSKLERVAFQSVPRVAGSCDLGSRRVPGFAQTAVCSIVGCRERDAFLDTSPFSA